MSNYTDIAFNPRTRQCQMATFIDDAYGPHTYGVRFDGDDTLYRPDQCDLRAAAAAITSLSQEVERLRKERDEANVQIEQLCDPTLQHLRIENGKFDMALGGEAIKRIALLFTEWFRESGAQNYVEMSLHARTEPFETYVVTVQKIGDGAQTPHQLRDAAERRLEEVRASLPPAFTAGMQMANAMFNLAQRGETTDDVRRQFDEMRKAWDAASPALASAIRSQSGASDV